MLGKGVDGLVRFAGRAGSLGTIAMMVKPGGTAQDGETRQASYQPEQPEARFDCRRVLVIRLSKGLLGIPHRPRPSYNSYRLAGGGVVHLTHL